MTTCSEKLFRKIRRTLKIENKRVSVKRFPEDVCEAYEPFNTFVYVAPYPKPVTVIFQKIGTKTIYLPSSRSLIFIYNHRCYFIVISIL